MTILAEAPTAVPRPPDDAGRSPAVLPANPRDLLPPAVFAKVSGFLAEEQEVTRVYAERALTQALIYLVAAANPHLKLHPSLAVDAAWHALLEHTEHYFDLSDRIAGRYLHHRPPPRDLRLSPDRSQAEMTRTVEAMQATRYGSCVDAEFWETAKPCCPPDPGTC